MSKLCEFHPKHFHLTCLYLLFFFHHHDHVHVHVHAQSSMEPVPTYITHHSWEPSVAITVGAIIFALLLMGIISIYLRRCAESHIIIATTQTIPCSCSQGITKDLLNTFPTLFYSNVRGKQALECAVCLTDFTDKDTLRLLPKCNHVFHPHCIDSWLASHVTCPVCRANLTQDSCQLAVTVSTQDEQGSGNRTEDTHYSEPNTNHQQLCVESPVSINDATKTGYINVEQQHSTNEQSSGLELSGNSNEGIVVVASERNNNLSRSNSTGHSLVEQGKCVERYTLRLPEDVRRYILVNHGRSVKGLCWSDSEESYARKNRLEKWVICTPPFVG